MVQFPRLPAAEILGGDPTIWESSASTIGSSRGGRPIRGLHAGSGGFQISLIGGCHADEPVGPAMLDRLASHLVTLPRNHELLRDCTWRIVPHVNPDGEARNRVWTSKRVDTHDCLGSPDHGYDLPTYLEHVARELPGDDIEFGFPRPGETPTAGLRTENVAVAEFLAEGAPIRVHGSFHGMGLAPGPWFLLEASWTDRTSALRARLAARVAEMGYRLFDAERHGEKGFHRIAPGFATRPDSTAMREFFKARGERDEAAKFRPSSMEFARAHGPDPLTFVSEMPLFLTPSLGGDLVEHHQLQELRNRLQEATARGAESLTQVQAELEISPMPIRDQMVLQLAFLDEALAAVLASEPVHLNRAQPEHTPKEGGH
ncbi:MAG: peptidase [bacterium]|nr:peptidase [bacterium]